MSDRVLERIGALLAKAESTDSEHEAEALTAKAQQLATLNAVDLAAARERRERRHRASPVQRKIVIGTRREQGRRHRVGLFCVVAECNDVRVDIARDSTYVLAFGFADDVKVVETLYASLATQMVSAANAAIRRGEHRREVYWSSTARAWRSDARVFRSAFNQAFVATVGERLAAAREEALAEDRGADAAVQGPAGPAPPTNAGTAPVGASSSAGALVLARKAEEVDAFYHRTSEARGTWQGARMRSVAWSAAGERSGRSAGRAARLAEPRSLPGARGELA